MPDPPKTGPERPDQRVRASRLKTGKIQVKARILFSSGTGTNGFRASCSSPATGSAHPRSAGSSKPCRFRQHRKALTPRGGREEEEALFKISLMRRGALKRVRWLVNAVYVAERIAHFTDSRTGAECFTHRVEEVAVTGGRVLQGI